MNRWLIIICLMMLAASCDKNKDSCECNPSETHKILSKILYNDLDYIDFTYDSKQRVSEVKLYYADTFSLEKYFYNDQNQIIKREYGEIYEDIYTYENGLLKTSESINKTYDGWHPKDVFIYNDQNRIIKADTYFNNELAGYINYKYDDRGNTTERKEYAYVNNEQDFLVSYFKFTYDNKKNPVFLLNILPVELIKKNNPVYTYYYLAIMSALPPEYESVFTYDKYGFPTQELRYHKNWPSETQPMKYTYIYE